MRFTKKTDAEIFEQRARRQAARAGDMRMKASDKLNKGLSKAEKAQERLEKAQKVQGRIKDGNIDSHLDVFRSRRANRLNRRAGRSLNQSARAFNRSERLNKRAGKIQGRSDANAQLEYEARQAGGNLPPTPRR